MKKRLLAVFVALVTLVCLISLVPSAQTVQGAAPKDSLLAGYAKVRIDPSEINLTGLPMSGYGNAEARLSSGGMDDTGDGKVTTADGLFATCVALVDQYGNIFLYFGIDLINAEPVWANVVKAQILEDITTTYPDLTLDYGNIVFNATHTHSGPDVDYCISTPTANDYAIKMQTYREFLYGRLRTAALNAMADRTEVTMTKGMVKASEALEDLYPNKSSEYHHLSYVRHYKNQNNVVGGSNFGYAYSADKNSKMVSDPVETMQVVKFAAKDGSKDPIVLVNWSAHATVNSTKTTEYGTDNHYKISSDYVNKFRYDLESAGYQAAFMQGAAGNISPTTTVSGLGNPLLMDKKTVLWWTEDFGPTGYKYGEVLADVTLWCLNNNMGSQLNTSFIRHVSTNFQYDTNPPSAEMLALVNAMLEYTNYPEGYADLIAYLTYNDTNWAKRTTYYSTFPYLEMVNSRHELSNAKAKRHWQDYPTSSMTVGAVAIGTQLSFVVSGCELFDRYDINATLGNTTANDWDNLVDPTYGMPLIMGYTNNGLGYVPNALAYDYNPNSTDYAPGSYESQSASYGRGTGEKLIAFYDELLDEVNKPVSQSRWQCECGGKAEGKNGHVCKEVEFLPWSMDDCLPTNGNYYLTNDVVITTQHNISQTLRLDLNGNTVTHKVAAHHGNNAYIKQQLGDESTLTHDTRVYTLGGSAYAAITDSVGGGKITRDLSNLTQVQQEAITNYGLIFLIPDGSTASLTLYNGTLDTTNQHADGGGCVALLDSNSSFKMYGGTLNGSIAKYGGAVYVRGHAEFYGGLVTGAVEKGTTWCGSITVATYNGISGRVTIGGDAQIYGSKLAGGGEANIFFTDPAMMVDNFTVSGDFTGKVGVRIYYPEENQIIGKSDNANFTIQNLYLDGNTSLPVSVSGSNLVIGETRTQCECGGTLTSGTYGHTCQEVVFRPWTDSTKLPSSGNYYLVTDVVTSEQGWALGELRLDLNGKTITHKVTQTGSTRVYTTYKDAYIAITDTVGGGKLTRDLSLLTDAQKAAIDNYGLIISIYDSEGNGSVTLYNGILDASGQVSAGGACVASFNAKPEYTATFQMYGGTLKGGNSINGSCIWAQDKVELYGGTITGGIAKDDNGAVYILSSGKLVLGGSANITGNFKADGTTPANITVNPNNFTVKGTYSGTAGLNTKLVANTIVGISDHAVITGSITGDQNTNDVEVIVSGSQLLVSSDSFGIAVYENGIATYYESFADALAEYPGGDAVITLLKDIDEDITITQATNIDLAGFDLTGNITANAPVQFKDSETDDYTILDDKGYGKIPNGLTNVSEMEGYVLIEEADGTSFHRLNLDFHQASLRTVSAGVYYTCQFGGDEVIKANVVAYGTALGAGQVPGFQDKTYTRFEGNADWICGIDADGYANNTRNGAILDGIMSEGYSLPVNLRNATMQIYNQSYVELVGGRRILGECISFSLKELMQGTSRIYGADEVFGMDGYLTDNQKNAIVDLYETYESIMSSWKVPNIKQALVDREDDGVLKVLMIGHSLGVDSTYFFPQVYKAETGKDIVVGTLYHSGCRLGQHAYYMNNNLQEYAYLEYDTSKDTAWRIYETSEGANGFVTHTANQAHDIYIGSTAAAYGNPNKLGVTMEFGITQHDWDIVVMQAGVFEAANVKDTEYFTINIAKDITTIQNYVKAQDINARTTPKFAWNVTWSAPEDKTLATDTYDTLLASEFGNSSVAMYNAIISTLENIVPQYKFDYIFHSGTSMENAKAVLTDKEVHRDMIHATDFSRLMVAYTWYCELTGTDIEDCKITSISSSLRFSTTDRNSGQSFTLSAAQKNTLITCVKNTLKNPLEVTQ